MTKVRCHLDDISKFKMLTDKLSSRFISKHFHLENGVKMSPKRRSFLQELFFTCFFFFFFGIGFVF